MTTAALLGLSLLIRTAAAAYPLVLYRRLRERRLLWISGAGAALVAEGAFTFGANGALTPLAISVLALMLVVLAGTVFTTRVWTVRQLERSEALHRMTLESGSDAVFISDDAGILTHLWPPVYEFFGMPADRVGVGESVAVLLGRVQIDRFELEKSGTLKNVEVALPATGNGVRRLLVNVKRVSIDGGTTLFACRDVTRIAGMETSLERALAEVADLKDRFEAEALYLKDELRADYNFEGIIGSSPRLQKMLAALETVANTESTVLIRGETGSGKELVARALHELSGRRERPLVKVNCAALPASLVESELFGHEKGAFTGAGERKPGRFELADLGTLFLDEVGELPLELQAKLLRVVQEGEFHRVGGTKTVRVDVRLLAATNRDLKAEVQAGRFRSDLFFRLEVFPIDVPALRERPEDLLLLASHFLEIVGATLGRPFDGFTHSSVRAMKAYSWPGNVRELRNIVERAAILSKRGKIDLVPFLQDPVAPANTSVLSDRLADVERAHILRVLNDTAWGIEGRDGAAAVLDLRPSTLRSRMKKLGINRSEAGDRKNDGPKLGDGGGNGEAAEPMKLR